MSIKDDPETRVTLEALLAVAFLATFAPVYAAIDEGLEEIAAAGELIEPGHTFLFLSYDHRGEGPDGQPLAFRTEPFVHVSPDGRVSLFQSRAMTPAQQAAVR